MKEKNQTIEKSLDCIVKSRYGENRTIKNHSVGMLIVLWIIAVIIGLFSFFVSSSIVTIWISIISFVLLFIGSVHVKRNDYKWFLYYCYNTCGIGIVMGNLLISISNTYELYYRISLITIFITSIILSAFVGYWIIDRKIKKGINYIDNNDGAVISLGCIPGGIGILISRALPEKVSLIIFMPIIGILVGAVCATTLTIYYYGKKYDPDCELIKNIQAVTEKNDVP